MRTNESQIQFDSHSLFLSLSLSLFCVYINSLSTDFFFLNFCWPYFCHKHCYLQICILLLIQLQSLHSFFTSLVWLLSFKWQQNIFKFHLYGYNSLERNRLFLVVVLFCFVIFLISLAVIFFDILIFINENWSPLCVFFCNFHFTSLYLKVFFSKNKLFDFNVSLFLWLNTYSFLLHEILCWTLLSCLFLENVVITHIYLFFRIIHTPNYET